MEYFIGLTTCESPSPGINVYSFTLSSIALTRSIKRTQIYKAELIRIVLKRI